jgi:hypothetical protein
MTIKIINTVQAVDLLKNHRDNGNGRAFGVTFVKRSDNTVRTLNARFGVTSALKGGKAAYNPADKGLMTVFDQNSQSYKSINLAAIKGITMDGEVYQVQ